MKLAMQRSCHKEFDSYNHVIFNHRRFSDKRFAGYGGSTKPELILVIICLCMIPVLRMFLPVWVSPPSETFDRIDKKIHLKKSIDFLIEPNVSSSTVLLVIVNSHAAERQLRNDIRASWGNGREYDSGQTKVYFILGRPATNHEMSLIREESDLHGDLLVASIKEDYYQLSVKTFAMLYYKKTRLPDTRCLLKADSDNVLNLSNYERLCDETIAPRIAGHCAIDTTVLRANSKWAIPRQMYQSTHWPTYCSTGAYLFCGRDVPSLILDAAERTAFLTSNNFRRLPEDVLFTGIFAEKAGVRRKHIDGMTFRDQPKYYCRETKMTFSIHMHRQKTPIYHYKRLLSQENGNCIL